MTQEREVKMVNLDRFADHLMAEIIKYESLHVGRVGAWVGLILMGIKNLAPDMMEQSHLRQLVFRYRGRNFKVRYNHKAEGAFRGGIELVEYIRQRQGAPDVAVIMTVKDLQSAEAFYKTLKSRLDIYIDTAFIPVGLTQEEVTVLIEKGQNANKRHGVGLARAS
jgi:hypothetical protein